MRVPLHCNTARPPHSHRAQLHFDALAQEVRFCVVGQLQQVRGACACQCAPASGWDRDICTPFVISQWVGRKTFALPLWAFNTFGKPHHPPTQFACLPPHTHNAQPRPTTPTPAPLHARAYCPARLTSRSNAPSRWSAVSTTVMEMSCLSCGISRATCTRTHTHGCGEVGRVGCCGLVQFNGDVLLELRGQPRHLHTHGCGEGVGDCASTKHLNKEKEHKRKSRLTSSVSKSCGLAMNSITTASPH